MSDLQHNITKNDILDKIIDFFPKSELTETYSSFSELGLKPTLKTLFKVVKKSHLPLVKAILEDPISEEWRLNERLPEEDNATLVEIAAENIVSFNDTNNLEILERILKRGVDPNHTKTITVNNSLNVPETRVWSSFISLTIFNEQASFPFSESTWKAIELLIEHGLNFTKKVYKNESLFQYWVQNYVAGKRKWDLNEINDFYKLLDLIIGSGQKFEFSQQSEGLLKTIHRDIKNDSRWHYYLLRLFRKFKVEIIENQVTNSDYLCLVCRENPRNRLLRPCNHLVTCHDCYQKIKKDQVCPSCRRIITEVIDVYFP